MIAALGCGRREETLRRPGLRERWLMSHTESTCSWSRTYVWQNPGEWPWQERSMDTRAASGQTPWVSLLYPPPLLPEPAYVAVKS